MSNRKSYNSILFLTVYLGLVLVGATPHVLAYAATTPSFDLRNEIGFKDDLDKNPDNDEIDDFPALESEKAIGEFINELKKINKSWRGISNKFIETSCGHTWTIDNSSGMASYTPDVDSSNVNTALNSLWEHYEKLIAIHQYDNLPSYLKYFDYTVEFGQKHSFQKRSLKVQVNFTHGSADQSQIFAEHLNLAFNKKPSQSKDKLTKVVYENTKAIVSDGYVSVVTNLPRASIDSLLK